MRNRINILLAIIPISTFLISMALFPTYKAKQPMWFDHKARIEKEEMECTDCHQGAKDSHHAQLPLLMECSDCHSEPPENLLPEYKDEEAKVREYLEKEMEIPWVKVNKYPGHVFFSHKAHAQIECKECHTRFRKDDPTSPYEKPDIKMSMYDCINCHRKELASVDCLICHK